MPHSPAGTSPRSEDSRLQRLVRLAMDASRLAAHLRFAAIHKRREEATADQFDEALFTEWPDGHAKVEPLARLRGP